MWRRSSRAVGRVRKTISAPWPAAVTARKSREPKPRTEPEVPRLLLSTLPFLALLVAMAVLTVAIMVIAWPGSQPQPRPKVAQHEEGLAPKGWFQEAKKEFR